jgi:ribosomal protein S18 acetylase RimI-like enzyme
MPDVPPEVRFAHHSGPTAASLGVVAYLLYAQSFLGPPHTRIESREEYLQRWARHSARPGFVFLTLSFASRSPVGFLYGYAARPGTWWYDTVSAALPTEVRDRWLTDAFELVELAVVPTSRGHGLGSLLLRRAFSTLPHRSVVLSTHRDRNPVVRLYLREGFEIIHPGLRFSESGEPFVVMARPL